MILREYRAVSAGTFSVLGIQIEKLVLHHEIKELSALLGKLTVHLLGFADKIFLISDRNRVSGRRSDGFVIIIECIDSKSFLLTLVQLCRCRNHDLADLFPEYLQLLFRIIKTAAAQISHRNKALKSKLLCHTGTDLYKSVINFL